MLPLLKSLLSIHVVLVGQELTELLLIRRVRSLDFATELSGSWFDADMPDPLVLYVSMEVCLTLVTSVGTERVDPKREFQDNEVDKGDGMYLVVTAVDLERSYPCGIIDGHIRKTSNSMPIGVLEAHNLHVSLHMMTRTLFDRSVPLDGPPTHMARDSIQIVPDKSPVDARTRDLDAVIPFQVLRYLLRAKARGVRLF